MIDLNSEIPVNWNKLFSHVDFQHGWFEVRRGAPRNYDNATYEYALGRLFEIESGVDFPHYSSELPYIFARCPASVSELQGSLKRELLAMVQTAIDGFVFLAWDYLGWPNTGSVTRGDTEHVGFRVGRGRR